MIRSGPNDPDHFCIKNLFCVPENIFKCTLNSVVDMLSHGSSIVMEDGWMVVAALYVDMYRRCLTC